MSADLTPGELAQLACILEATARKPGNVHRFSDFDDTSYLDFLLSAVAIGRALDRAGSIGVGAACLAAVDATRRLVSTNTNLGMVLLLAPLAAAASRSAGTLRARLAAVLEATTIDDARRVYQAIRQANPGGLGRSAEQDVALEPTTALVEAMRLAADRDAVARQYAHGYPEVFDVALPALSADRPLETSIVAAHLALMSALPDTLIARKRGRAEAVESSRRAARVLEEGWPDQPSGLARLVELDDWLRADGRGRNPGATADLVAAGLFVALHDGTIPMPVSRGRSWWSPPIDSVELGGGRPREAREFAPAEGTSAVTGSKFKVRVEKDYLVFCSGHFITYNGDQCERLHGHNYRVAVEVEGPLDENSYVFDFIALKDLTRGVTDTLDHRMLLPTRSRLVTLSEDGANWLVRYRDRRWSFPRDECVLLPIENTTAELLGDYIGVQLREAFLARGLTLPEAMRVEVEESFGQSATVDWRRPSEGV